MKVIKYFKTQFGLSLNFHPGYRAAGASCSARALTAELIEANEVSTTPVGLQPLPVCSHFLFARGREGSGCWEEPSTSMESLSAHTGWEALMSLPIMPQWRRTTHQDASTNQSGPSHSMSMGLILGRRLLPRFIILCVLLSIREKYLVGFSVAVPLSGQWSKRKIIFASLHINKMLWFWLHIYGVGRQ